MKNKSISIKDFLESKNIHPQKKFSTYGMYLSPLRHEKTGSFKVDYNKNLWFDFGLNQGGNLKQLIERLEAGYINHPKVKNIQIKIIKNKFKIFDVKSLNNANLVEYIKSRKINLNSIKTAVSEVYYGESQDKKYYGIGLFNDEGGCEVRNKNFKGCIGKKSITSFYNNSDTLILFEGMFDYFTFLNLYPNKFKHNYIILNSTANLKKSLKYLNDHKKVITFFDNDDSGRISTRIIKNNTKMKFIDMSQEYKNFRDLNDYLISRYRTS